MLGPPERGASPGRPYARWTLALLAPVAAAVTVAHLLPPAGLSVAQRLGAFAGVKLGADLLRGRAWPGRERFADDIAREWLAWALVAAAYLAAAWAAGSVGRPAPGPLWPALLAYWILWLR